MALVREAEALGTAMESHQLGSVSQRYSVYKRTRDEFEATKFILLKKIEECDKLIYSFRNCLQTIHINDMLTYLQEADELLNLNINSEFDLICDFLEQTAQSQMFIQCDQTRRELDSSLKQQMRIVRETFEILIQYGTVMKYYPLGQQDNHRCAKYAQWSRFLIEQKSVQSCRDVVLQYHTTLDRSISSPVFDYVALFNRQFQNAINDTNEALQKSYEKLNNEYACNNDLNRACKIQENDYNEAKLSLAQFLSREKGAQRALESIISSALCEINKRFLKIENAAASSADNLVDLTSNGKWFLDELQIIATLSTELCSPLSHLCASEKSLSTALKILTLSCNVYSTLRNIKNAFITDILPSASSGILSEDKSVLDMIATVSNLQQGLIPLPELLNNLKNHLRCTMLNLPSSNVGSINIADKLYEKLTALKLKYEQNDENDNLGRSLFLNFYDLFDKLDVEHTKLMNAFDGLVVNSNWIKLDQMKDAKNLGVS